MKKKRTPVSANNDFRYWIFIFLFAFVLYGNTIGNFYSLDDELVVKDNPQVKNGISAIPEIFASRLTKGLDLKNNNYGYRPIAKSTFAIEHEFFGQNPHISHFFNVLLFALTGIFLFSVLKKLFRNHHPLLPLVTTILFVVHPIHTEVVASLKNRDELLAFIGCLGVVHFILRYSEKGKITAIAFAILSMIFAFYSKQDSITFLAVIPLVLYFFTDASFKKIAAVSFSIFLSLFIVFLITRKLLPEGNRVIMYYENPLYFTKDFLTRTATGFYGLGHYLVMMVFPLHLSFYYGYNEIPIVNWTNIISILSFIFYAGIFIYAIRKIKSKHILSFSVLYFICTISIYANIVTPVVGIVADRFLYLASLGFCIATGYLFCTQIKGDSWKNIFVNKPVVIIILLTSVSYSSKTISRNADWKNDYTLYMADISHLENSIIALDKAAGTLAREAEKEKNAMKQKEMIDEAIRLYKKSIAVYPDFNEGMNNLATIYTNCKNDYVSAENLLEKAVALDTTHTQSKFNLAFCYAKNGKKEKAIAMYEKALSRQPKKDINNYVNLANIYFESGNLSKAVEVYENASFFFPESDLPYFQTGVFYFKTGDTLNAISNWEKALEKNPGNKNLSMGVGKYYEKHGNRQKADFYLNKAGFMQPKQ